MSTYATRPNSRFPVPNDDCRIEFEDDVLPPPVSRLASTAHGGSEDEETFEAQLQRTQEELLQLRHQARVVERRKEELEEITRKERDYTGGRAEMHQKLSRVLVTLERTSGEAQRQLEMLLQAREDLSRHYRVVSSMVIDDWSAPGVAEHADHALAAIADARTEYERIIGRVGACLDGGHPASRPETAAARGDQGFRYWLRCGFAFTLPLMVLGAVALTLTLIF